MIELPWPPANLNPNKKQHYMKLHSARKKYKRDCLWMLKAQNPEKCMSFSVIFCPPDRRKRDRDNIIGAFKSGQDALAEYWGVDDNDFNIQYRPLGEPIKGGVVIIERNDDV